MHFDEKPLHGLFEPGRTSALVRPDSSETLGYNALLEGVSKADVSTPLFMGMRFIAD